MIVLPAIGDDELFVFNQGADGGRVYFYIEQSVCARLQGDFVASGQGHGASWARRMPSLLTVGASRAMLPPSLAVSSPRLVMLPVAPLRVKV